jgi:hypothetical protein
VTSTFFLLRRPPWIRFGLAGALILSAAIVGRCFACDDEWATVFLIAVAGLQLMSATLSLGLAVVAGIRFGRREALAEVGVGVLMLLAIFAAITAALFFAPRVCE